MSLLPVLTSTLVLGMYKLLFVVVITHPLLRILLLLLVVMGFDVSVAGEAQIFNKVRIRKKILQCKGIRTYVEKSTQRIIFAQRVPI